MTASDRPKPLSPAEIEEALARVPEWTVTDGRVLERTVTLPHLPAAILVVHIAQIQSELDHHADIALGYNTVHFATTSHSEGSRLTSLDFTLAARIDAACAAHGAHPPKS
ncbi:hypothetical protein BIV57_17270 [Mangrovactinospora gilvigrisea]|uniref:Putative pterin-4-alpha-carbinolamine dehydratase n=1 Tax=Mangrovactinospora gilvigrisea TaxID=1428644 RepID=A0A1J7BC49_9ACTN|nr:4a-hydroxytetrahydrobiopterin dehydratase [Mangrovactinospora gilvigrisea]OIV36243.1 hypothetical protein BIV57_17270 [Mangrovactinospora gilvigrisea]